MTREPASTDAASNDPSPSQAGSRPAASARQDTPTDELVTTRHTAKIGGRQVRYTATTGRMVLRSETWDDAGAFTGHTPKAAMFVTSYVADARKGERRPVTFAFNGGPGSSSVWLHLGLLGPRRVDSGDVGALTPPPYGLLDNPESLLAVSDLVFIDPVSTGYSRPVDGEKSKDFHGFGADLDSVAELIRLWVTRNNRWLSPKLIAGESYGTTRAAALVDLLQQRHAMPVNGVILISAVLDFATLSFDYASDRAYAAFLPTYAAIAHYHGRHGRRSLPTVVREAEEYAARDYLLALAAGNRLTAAERRSHAERIGALTGLDPDYVERSRLRVEHQHFYAELLRSEGLVVGRLDSRFTGPAHERVAATTSDDPSYTGVAGAYAAAWNHYVRAELGYESDLPYTQLSFKANEEWSFKEFEARPIDVTDRLASAMRANPHLRVHIAYGYYDGATPIAGVTDTLSRLQVPAEALDRIEHHFYEAGHMMYVHEPSRVAQSRDLAAFVQIACAR